MSEGNPRRADLHVHMHKHMRPLDLLALAAERSVSVLGVGNHDVIDGIKGLTVLAREYTAFGVEIIPAVDLTVYGQKRMQFRAFYTPIFNTDFVTDLYFSFGLSRSNRVFAMAQRFNDLRTGMEISHVLLSADFDTNLPLSLAAYVVKHYAGHPAIQSLTDGKKGFDRVSAVFDHYFHQDAPLETNCYEPPNPYFPTPEKALAFCAKWGMVSFWAAPAEKHTLEEIAVLVPQFRAMHLQGIDAYHPGHTPADVEFLLGLAQQHQLIVGGGSDFSTSTEEYLDGSPHMMLGRFPILETVQQDIYAARQRMLQ